MTQESQPKLPWTPEIIDQHIRAADMGGKLLKDFSESHQIEMWTVKTPVEYAKNLDDLYIVTEAFPPGWAYYPDTKEYIPRNTIAFRQFDEFGETLFCPFVINDKALPTYSFERCKHYIRPLNNKEKRDIVIMAIQYLKANHEAELSLYRKMIEVLGELT